MADAAFLGWICCRRAFVGRDYLERSTMGTGWGVDLSRYGDCWCGFHGQCLVNKTIQPLSNGQFWFYITYLGSYFKRSVTGRYINLGSGDGNRGCGNRLVNSNLPNLCKATNLVLVADACNNLVGEIQV